MSSGKPLVITGHRPDAILMKWVFAPLTRFLTGLSGKSNFYWARRVYLLGMAFSITLVPITIVDPTSPPGLITTIFLWISAVGVVVVDAYSTVITFRMMRRLEDACRDHEDTLSIMILIYARFFIVIRWAWLLLAFIPIVVSILEPHQALVSVWGVATFGSLATGCFMATCIAPPGQGAWSRAKNWLASHVQTRHLSPAPSAV